MLPIYQKLNYLVGVTTTSYSGAGLMRGNFIRMTVGDYLLDVPGIIQSINLKPSFETGWDLNRKENGIPFKLEDNSLEGDEFVGQLPRMIEIDLQFTPIHDFTPQIGENFVKNISKPSLPSIVPASAPRLPVTPSTLFLPTFRPTLSGFEDTNPNRFIGDTVDFDNTGLA